MLVLDIDYRPQSVPHALQVREFHSMLGRGARTSTFRVRVINIQLGLGCARHGMRWCGKRRAYVSGSGGVSMYTSNARRMRVMACIQLDSGLRWMFER